MSTSVGSTPARVQLTFESFKERYYLLPFFNRYVEKSSMAGWLVSWCPGTDERIKRLFKRAVPTPAVDGYALTNVLITEREDDVEVPHARSYLQPGDHRPITVQLFKALTGRINFLGHLSPSKWLSYLGGADVDTIQQAERWEERLVAIGQTSEQHDALVELAGEIHSSLGDKTYVFSGCGNHPSRLLNYVQGLGKDSEIGEHIVDEIRKGSFQPLFNELAQIIEKKYSETFEDKKEFQELLEKLLSDDPTKLVCDRWFMGFVRAFLPKLLTQGVFDSALDTMPGSAKATLSPLKQLIKDHGLKEALEQYYASNSAGGWGHLEHVFNETWGQFASFLPAAALPALGTFGVAPLNQPIWYKFEKQASTLYKLTIYIQGVDGSGKMEYTYKDIDAGDITPDLIYRLLSFQVRPKANDESYTTRQIIEGLSAYFKKDVIPNGRQPTTHAQSQIATTNSYIPLLAPKTEAEEIEMRRQALISLWFSEGEKDYPLLISEAEALVQDLPDDDRMKATLKEIKDAYAVHKAANDHPPRSYLLPPTVQGYISYTVNRLGLCPEYGQLIRDVMCTVFGDEIGVSVDRYLDELQMPEHGNFAPSWSVTAALFTVISFVWNYLTFFSWMLSGALINLAVCSKCSWSNIALYGAGAQALAKIASGSGMLDPLAVRIREQAVKPAAVYLVRSLVGPKAAKIAVQARQLEATLLRKGEITYGADPIIELSEPIELNVDSAQIEVSRVYKKALPPTMSLETTSEPLIAANFDDLITCIDKLDNPHQRIMLIMGFFQGLDQIQMDPLPSVANLHKVALTFHSDLALTGLYYSFTYSAAACTSVHINVLMFESAKAEDPRLGNFQIYPWEFLARIYGNSFSIYSREAAEHFQKLCAHLNIDPATPITETQVHDHADNALFSNRCLYPVRGRGYAAFYQGNFYHDGILRSSSYDTKDRELFECLMEDEGVQRRLSAFIPDWTTFDQNVFWKLFENPTLQDGLDHVNERWRELLTPLREQYYRAISKEVPDEAPDNLNLTDAQKQAIRLAFNLRTEDTLEPHLHKPENFLYHYLSRTSEGAKLSADKARIEAVITSDGAEASILPPHITALRHAVLLNRSLVSDRKASSAEFVKITRTPADYQVFQDDTVRMNFKHDTVTTKLMRPESEDVLWYGTQGSFTSLFGSGKATAPQPLREFRGSAPDIYRSDHVLRNLVYFIHYDNHALFSLFTNGYLLEQLNASDDVAYAIGFSIETRFKSNEGTRKTSPLNRYSATIMLREYTNNAVAFLYKGYEYEAHLEKEPFQILNAYGALNPSTFKDAQKYRLYPHFVKALWHFAQNHTPFDDSEDVFQIWLPQVKHDLDSNEELRNHVLSFLHEGAWTGTFPNFACEGYGNAHLLLGAKTTEEYYSIEEIRAWNHAMQPVDGQQNTYELEGKTYKALPRIPSKVQEDEDEKIKAALKTEEVDLAIHDIEIERTVEANDEQAFTCFNSGEGLYFMAPPPRAETITLHKKFDGQRHNLIKNIDLPKAVKQFDPKTTLFWLSVNTPRQTIVTDLDFSPLARMTVGDGEEVKITHIDHFVEGHTFEQIDLSATDHGLSLLEWFDPRIEAYALKNAPRKVARIRFPNLDLDFDLKMIDGEVQAVNAGKFSGYWIAKDQRDVSLHNKTRYLKLVNADGKVKILLASSHGISSIAVDTMKQFFSSPFLQRQIESVLTESLLKAPKHRFYAYSQEKGRLVTTDPSACAFLFYEQACSGKIAEAKRTLQDLSATAQQGPLDDTLAAQVEWIQLSLLSSSLSSYDSDISLLALKLGAIITENTAKHPTQKPQSRAISWIALQIQYHQYLEQQAEGLTSFEELFILRGISKFLEDLLVSRLDAVPDFYKNMAERAGISMLVRCNLMAPALSKRYQELRLEDGESVGRLEKTIVDRMTNPSASTAEMGEIEWPRHLMQAITHPLFHTKWEDQLLPVPPADANAFATLPLTLSEMTPSIIFDNFYLYYCLARKERPDSKYTVDQDAFDAQCETFAKIIGLVQIHSVNDPSKALLCMLLHQVAHTSSIASFKDKLCGFSAAELLQAHDNGQVKEFVRRLHGVATTNLVAYLAMPESARDPRQIAGTAASALVSICSYLSGASSDLATVNGISWISDAITNLPATVAATRRMATQASQMLTVPPIKTLNPLQEAKVFNPLQHGDDLKALDDQFYTTLDTISTSDEPTFVASLQKLKATYEEAIAIGQLELLSRSEEQTFEDLMLAFVQSRSPDELEYPILYHRLIATHLQHIERILAKTGASAIEECKRRRYRPAGNKYEIFKYLTIFEEVNNTLVRQPQADSLLRLIESDHKRHIAELVVGSGKTFFIIPESATILTKVFPGAIKFNLFPDNVFATNAETVGEQHMKNGAKAPVFHFHRHTNYTEELLWTFVKALRRAQKEGDVIVMTRRSWKSFELAFRDHAYKYIKDNTLPYQNKIELFAEALRLRDSHGIDFVDEIHSNDPELCYSLGPKQTMAQRQTEVDTIDRCAQYIALVPDWTPEDLRLHLLEKAKIDPAAEKYSKEEQAQLDLIKQLVNELAPLLKKRVLYVNWGPSRSDPKSEVAVLYKGNNTPSDGTIKNPHEAMFRTCFMRYQIRLSDAQLQHFVDQLIDAQSDSDRDKKIQGWFNKHFSPYDLSDLSPDDRDRLIEDFKKDENITGVTSLYNRMNSHQITFYEQSMRSTAADGASQTRRTIGLTGTAKPKKGIYLPNHDGTIHIDDDTSATDEIEGFIRASELMPLNGNNGDERLGEFIARASGDESITGLVDAGALLPGMRAYDIAKRLLNELPERVKGIAYYDESGRAWVYERHTQNPIPYKQSSLKPEERFTYLAHMQRFAADIPQPYGAKLIVTFDDTTCFETGLAQGMGRGLRGDQREDKQFILAHPDACDVPNQQAVIDMTKATEKQMQLPGNYKSDIEKIEATVKRAVSRTAYYAKTFEERIQILEDNEPLFITTFDPDPTKLYSGEHAPADPTDLIAAKKGSYALEGDDQAFVDNIGNGNEYPPQIIARNFELEEEQEIEAETEAETELATETETEREQEQETETQEAPPSIPIYKFEAPIPWSEDLSLDTEWWKKTLTHDNWATEAAATTGCPLFTFHEGFRKTEAGSLVERFMPKNLLCTNHLLPILTSSRWSSPINPEYHRRERAIYAIIITHPPATGTINALDEKTIILGNLFDANSFAKRIPNMVARGYSIALYDLENRVIRCKSKNAPSTHDLHSDQDFKIAEAMIQISNGETDMRADYGLGAALTMYMNSFVSPGENRKSIAAQMRTLFTLLRKNQSGESLSGTPLDTLLTNFGRYYREKRNGSLGGVMGSVCWPGTVATNPE